MGGVARGDGPLGPWDFLRGGYCDQSEASRAWDEREVESESSTGAPTDRGRQGDFRPPPSYSESSS